jgi:hypothetical protein
MAHARVVEFEGVDQARIDELARNIQEDTPPVEIPATEMILLHDADGERSLAIIVFESEEDYERGHAALDAMPAENTLGRRSSVRKYKVAAHRTV